MNITHNRASFNSLNTLLKRWWTFTASWGPCQFFYSMSILLFSTLLSAHPPQKEEYSSFSRGWAVSSSRQLLNVSSFQAHSWLYQAVLFSPEVLRTSENICYLFSWLCDLKYMQNWSPFTEESQLMDNSGRLSTTFINIFSLLVY